MSYEQKNSTLVGTATSLISENIDKKPLQCIVSSPRRRGGEVAKWSRLGAKYIF